MDYTDLFTRISAIPLPIRSRMGSEETVDTIGGFEQQFSLPEGSSGKIARLLRDLQLKDLSAAKFDTELTSQLGLTKDAALPVLKAIKNEILSPIANELMSYGIDIAPIGTFQAPLPKATVIKDIASPAIPGAAPAMKISVTPPPSPQDLSGKGWSKMKAPVPPPAPMPAPSAPAPTPLSSAPRPSAAPSPFPAAPGAPMPGKMPAQGGAPVMLSKETSFASPAKNTDFHFSKPTEDAKVDFSRVNMQPKVMPAVIEFNQAPASKDARPAVGAMPPTQQRPGVPPLSSSPVANAGDRTVTEFTSAPVPPPPTPPQMPPPPPPPPPPAQPVRPPQGNPPPQQGPAQQTPKVIVKNFP